MVDITIANTVLCELVTSVTRQYLVTRELGSKISKIKNKKYRITDSHKDLRIEPRILEHLTDKDAMEEFILNIKILNGVLGHKFLEKKIEQNVQSESTKETISQPKEEATVYLNIRNIVATAIQTDEGLVVLTGSLVSETESPNYGYKTLRDELILDGTISKNDRGRLTFVRDYLFNSPSAAAAVIVGYSINGRKNWKNKGGKTLTEMEVKEII